MITNVTGGFPDVEMNVETEGDDFSTANVEVTIKTGTVNSGSEQRDNHLRSEDFFNAEKYPEMKFVSTNVKKTGDNEYKLTGDLTIREVTKPISLDVVFEGIVKDPWGNTKAGFTVNGKLNRKDFNLNWNVVTEAGGLLVSEEVKIHASIQLSKQQ
jgi:polyisoprenoid-binding protein YceI